MPGCVVNRAFIFDRGGRRRLGVVVPASSITYDRIRDDISTSLIHISADLMTEECDTLLHDVEPGRHELVIYRGDQRVWEGPITRAAYTRNGVTLEARDIWHYAYRTILREAYDNTYPNVSFVTERARVMLTRELARKEALDPPINVLPYLSVHTVEGTAKTSRATLPFQKTLWEDIDDMAARGGLDYTAIGRQMFVFDTHDVIGRTRVLSDADFLGDVTITAYGMELATYSAVTDGEGKWGAVGGVDPYYGEWEVLHTAYDEGIRVTRKELGEMVPELTTEELISQARRNMDGRFPTPYVLRVPDGSALNPATATEIFQDLVPGVRVPIQASLRGRTFSQEQKLDRLRVVESDRGETVSVTLSPAPGVSPFGDENGDSSAA